jgi:hypothetical protein
MDSLENRLFLLALATAAIGLPGCGDDADNGGGTSSGGETGTSSSTSAPGTSSSDPMDTSGGTTGATQGSSSTGGPDQGSSSTGDPGEGSGSTGGVDSNVCPDYANWVAGCGVGMEYADVLEYCSGLLTMSEETSAECLSLTAELLVCLTGQDCSVVENDTVPKDCVELWEQTDPVCYGL